MEKSEKTVKTLGNRRKDGVIMKCNSGFNYYHGQSDTGLAKLIVPGGRSGTRKVKTIKVFESVEIANKEMTITVHPSGKVEMQPNTV